METKKYVGVVVKCDNKVLLCKRNRDGSYPGMWSVPAGKLEKNESTKECAIREFKEETDKDISNMDLKFVGTIPRYTRDGKKIKGIMYVYLIDVETEIEPDFDSAKDGDEHTEWRYYKKNEIRSEYTGIKLHRLLEIILSEN